MDHIIIIIKPHLFEIFTREAISLVFQFVVLYHLLLLVKLFLSKCLHVGAKRRAEYLQKREETCDRQTRAKKKARERYL